MRKRRYGENLLVSESKTDEANWKLNFMQSVKEKNYNEVALLLREALSFNYDVPSTSDPEVLRIMSLLGFINQ